MGDFEIFFVAFFGTGLLLFLFVKIVGPYYERKERERRRQALEDYFEAKERYEKRKNS